MVKKLITFLVTLRYLKPVQVGYRLKYSLRNLMTPGRYPLPEGEASGNPLKFDPFIPAQGLLHLKNEFCFLNLRHDFGEIIDWNFKAHGKLWTYNLNYFEFLLQEDIDVESGRKLIVGYCEALNRVRDGLEPYPVSLRGINWIKFFSKHNLHDPESDNCLFRQYILLTRNLEYHLLGNHLLENGFSLLFASYYFRSEDFYKKARHILERELREQVLPDGAHFELSTLYHQIILYRLLDCINLVRNNNWKGHEMLDLFLDRAGLMLSWIRNVTWQDGSIPLLNDAANNITPPTVSLIQYARVLEVKSATERLNESGYRKITGPHFDLIFDIGKIGADYQPGHVHADIFSFELRIDGKPVIVDTGTSTYEPGERRSFERGTAAHNTVEIDGQNQSEVWASHRVGRRAKVSILTESENEFIATHNGYRKLGIIHKRVYRYDGDRTLVIKDSLAAQNPNYTAVARFHFHPDVILKVADTKVMINGLYNLYFDNAIVLADKEYFYAPEFNKLISARCIEVRFHTTLKTRFEL